MGPFLLGIHFFQMITAPFPERVKHRCHRVKAPFFKPQDIQPIEYHSFPFEGFNQFYGIIIQRFPSEICYAKNVSGVECFFIRELSLNNHLNSSFSAFPHP